VQQYTALLASGTLLGKLLYRQAALQRGMHRDWAVVHTEKCLSVCSIASYSCANRLQAAYRADSSQIWIFELVNLIKGSRSPRRPLGLTSDCGERGLKGRRAKISPDRIAFGTFQGDALNFSRLFWPSLRGHSWLSLTPCTNPDSDACFFCLRTKRCVIRGPLVLAGSKTAHVQKKGLQELAAYRLPNVPLFTMHAWC
jgi:hypothetical protein